MQIIELELSHSDLYCPATGEVICNEEVGMNEEAKSLMGYWIDEVFMEPFIKNESLKAAWELLVEKTDAAAEAGEDDEGLDTLRLVQFLTEYESGTWVVFQITNYGLACGPVPNTIWYVIDMEKEQDDE